MAISGPEVVVGPPEGSVGPTAAEVTLVVNGPLVVTVRLAVVRLADAANVLLVLLVQEQTETVRLPEVGLPRVAVVAPQVGPEPVEARTS